MNNFIDHEKPFKMDIQVLVTFYKLGEPETQIQPLFKKPNKEPSEVCESHQDISEKLERDIGKIQVWVEMFNEMASNWILKSVDQVTYDCSQINFVNLGYITKRNC